MGNRHSDKRNHLAGETSPYLLQHADNPVDWHPWNAETLQRARDENKPIFLSIGYSACHWCHVMAHESFEDEATAEVLNRCFINIKVDREERPDLDKIYQTAHHILSQRPGGWPLSVFLTPDDHMPFFAGTYFPKEARFNLPAFRDLAQRIADYYEQNKSDIEKHRNALIETLAQANQTSAIDADQLTPEPLDMARHQLAQNYDARLGGFGHAPKFPNPTSIERLLRHHSATASAGHADDHALEMATFTLRQMALGGMNDQIGGGFCRYSVDDRWMIPHFEKMLYDNGPLLSLYSAAFEITGEPLFRRTLENTVTWVLREMRAPDGGFYSSLDADSEGEEGKFYVWTPDEVRALIDAASWDVIAPHFGFDRPANFEGKWNPHVYQSRDAIARNTDKPLADIDRLIDSALPRLFNARAKRVPPGRDDKILTSWNALMIKGLAEAGRALGRSDWIDAASRALDFVFDTLFENGRLLATCKDGRAHLSAYLDDYAFLVDAIVALLQARWRDGDLQRALGLAEVLLDQFEDKANGGFWFTANDHETLIHRPRSFADEAIPSGNGIAALALGRLGHLTGEQRYLEAAQRTLSAAWDALRQMPSGHNALLTALEEHLYPPQMIVLRGEGSDLKAWQQQCQTGYHPRRLVFAIPATATNLPGLLGERQAQDHTVAWICDGQQCRPPITALDELQEMLGVSG